MNASTQDPNSNSLIVYVGTYTGGASKGIYVCRLDKSSGELLEVGIAAETENPSYLAIDAKRNRLFTVNEVTEFDGQTGGAISAFVMQPATGELSFINQRYSHGGAPCYLALDYTGRYLLVANYIGGNVTVIPVGDSGVLNEPSDTIAHAGSSLHPKRQKGPHPHSIVLDLANKYAFVPDLGLDKVVQYRFDRVTGRLFANRRPWVEVSPGSGPRHLVFHPNGRNAYVINELKSTITAYEYDRDRGTLKHYQTVSTIPEGFSGENIAADLHVTSSGRFLLGSNRGHDSIAFYGVDPESGSLTLVDFIPTQGRTPRGFTIDPTGNYVLVANQDSHNIVTFRIDQDAGAVFPTGHRVQIPRPVCIKFLAG